MSEWQPIETAPKDGTHILLTDKAQWPCVVADFWDRDGDSGWGNWSCVTDYGQPTHWMPLPPPPEAKP